MFSEEARKMLDMLNKKDFINGLMELGKRHRKLSDDTDESTCYSCPIYKLLSVLTYSDCEQFREEFTECASVFLVVTRESFGKTALTSCINFIKKKENLCCLEQYRFPENEADRLAILLNGFLNKQYEVE